ncbi:hypothetical protein TW86_13475 [Halomonas sp. S2151]|uniref:hypothetical protein n=1 Tax=Halomonas sp. S2151 TaxID=579478 RepID=UPI0005F9B8B4|nr:hypothetical protein [Halomonas sp. S2151]KJZ10896.1 hypothetical protein TW86_13475 [Halomonas sp. S2151]
MTTRKPWSRDELAQLEAMLADGLTQPQIAEKLGRTRNSVRAKCEYIGLKSGRGCHWRAKDPAMVAEIRDIIEECIDFRGMPGIQITRHLNALGYEVSNAWVHKQITAMGPHMRQWAKQNASRAIALKSKLASQHRPRTADGSWERRTA